jgi:hypothetical protein
MKVSDEFCVSVYEFHSDFKTDFVSTVPEPIFMSSTCMSAP